jgi:hypothetical protein
MISELKESYVDFIGMYENVYPEGFCDFLIEEFERFQKNGWCGTRKETENSDKRHKDDLSFFININNHTSEMKMYEGFDLRHNCQEGLQRCFDAYVQKYDILNKMGLRSSCIKMQKTNPGQGYHIWHCEQGNGNMTNRCLVWAIYLNDIENAGETEFLYQKLRIAPKKNTCVIWPAAYTHTHRGNVVHGEKSKYIMTGWFYLE